MNIIELAKEVEITSPDEFKLTVNPVQIEKLQAFANAVIAEREKELIAGVGEPHKCCLNCTEHGECHPNNERGCDYRPEFEYTKEQVAGAIAVERRKHKVAIGIANITIEAEGRRIAALEAEAAKGQAEWQIRLDADNRCVEAERKRIDTLESTLKLSLEALDQLMKFQVKHLKVWINPAYDNAYRVFNQIKEVLHAE